LSIAGNYLGIYCIFLKKKKEPHRIRISTSVAKSALSVSGASVDAHEPSVLVHLQYPNGVIPRLLVSFPLLIGIQGVVGLVLS